MLSVLSVLSDLVRTYYTYFKGAPCAPRAWRRDAGGQAGAYSRKRAQRARREPAAPYGGRSPYRDSARRRPPRHGSRQFAALAERRNPAARTGPSSRRGHC